MILGHGGDGIGVLTIWARHPRAGLAVRVAVAAGLAWLVAQLIPAAADYPYYAPLGAVVATSHTVVNSLKGSLRAALAVLLGAVIALAARWLFDADVFVVAGVVAVGVLVAGMKVLGEMGTWVPTAALFVLVVGDRNPDHYVGAYLGLVLLGGLIGTAVAVAVPQLLLEPADQAVSRLRRLLVQQLSSVAEGLDRDRPPDADGWAERLQPLDKPLWQMRNQLHQAEESQRGNVRAHRRRERLNRIRRQAHALERTTWLVQDLTAILSEDEKQENETLGLGGKLRPPLAIVLRSLAEVLTSVTEQGADPDRIADLRENLDALGTQVSDIRTDSADDGLHVASNVVNSIRRILLTISPRNATD